MKHIRPIYNAYWLDPFAFQALYMQDVAYAKKLLDAKNVKSRLLSPLSG